MGFTRGAPSQAGYTIIELAAVTIIVTILALAGVATIRTVGKADISTTAGRLSASIRYMFDLAALNNRTYRLVVDIEGGSWWAEAIDLSNSCGTAILPSEEERKYGPELTREQEEEAAAVRSGGAASPGVGQGESRPRRDNLLTRRKLPKGISFGGVMTTHQDEPTLEGQGEVYFFPSGYVERAFIFLRRDDEVYTIETIPLKGVGVVHARELDIRDLLDET
jgi:general secretion pathway protein H